MELIGLVFLRQSLILDILPSKNKNFMDARPTRNEFHQSRRIFHMLSGLAIVVVACPLEKKTMVTVLALMTLVALFVEAVRLQWESLNKALARHFRSLMRDGEERRLSGITYYLIGCTISALVFPKEIALLSILFLAFGDPIASLVGLRYGKPRRNIPDDKPFKSLAGSLACFFTCFLITFILSTLTPIWRDLSWVDRGFLGFIGGAGGTLGELLPIRTDDNLSLPLISGAFFWLLSSLFNLSPGLYFL